MSVFLPYQAFWVCNWRGVGGHRTSLSAHYGHLPLCAQHRAISRALSLAPQLQGPQRALLGRQDGSSSPFHRWAH